MDVDDAKSPQKMPTAPDAPLPSRETPEQRAQMEERMAHIAQVAFDRAIEETPSDVAAVNLLIHFKAQVDVLQACGAFDDRSTVIGRMLSDMSYEDLVKSIDEHIALERQNEPEVDMDAYMASDRVPTALPYGLDESLRPSDGARDRLVDLNEQIFDEILHAVADAAPDPADLQERIRIEAYKRAPRIAKMETNILQEMVAKSDRVLKNVGKIGPWEPGFDDRYMQGLIEADKRQREGTVPAAPDPWFVRGASRGITAASAATGARTPAEDLERLLQQQGTRQFAGVGVLQEFKDVRLLTVNRNQQGGAHFLLSTVKYQTCMMKREPGAALATIVPMVLAFSGFGAVWVVGSMVAVQIGRYLVNRAIAQRANGATIATIVGAPTASLAAVGIPATEAFNEYAVLDACASAQATVVPRTAAGVAGAAMEAGWDALSEAPETVTPDAAYERTLSCARAIAKCATQKTSSCDARPAHLIKYATPGTKPGSGLAREGAREFFRLRQKAPSVDAVNAATENTPWFQYGLTALCATGKALYGFHWRYRPDRARQFLYFNKPDAGSPVRLEIERQQKSLEALRLMHSGRNAPLPAGIVPADPQMRCTQWLVEEERLRAAEVTGWEQAYANGGWNVENGVIVEMAQRISGNYVMPLVLRRETLRRDFGVGLAMFETLMQLLRVFPTIAGQEDVMNAKLRRARVAAHQGPGGLQIPAQEPEQAGPEAVDGALAINEVGHDWYALRMLLRAFRCNVRGYPQTHADPPTPRDLECLVFDMKTVVGIVPAQNQETNDHKLQGLLSIARADDVRTLERLFNKYLSPGPPPQVLQHERHWNRIKAAATVVLRDADCNPGWHNPPAPPARGPVRRILSGLFRAGRAAGRGAAAAGRAAGRAAGAAHQAVDDAIRPLMRAVVERQLGRPMNAQEIQDAEGGADGPVVGVRARVLALWRAAAERLAPMAPPDDDDDAPPQEPFNGGNDNGALAAALQPPINNGPLNANEIVNALGLDPLQAHDMDGAAQIAPDAAAGAGMGSVVDEVFARLRL